MEPSDSQINSYGDEDAASFELCENVDNQLNNTVFDEELCNISDVAETEQKLHPRTKRLSNEIGDNKEENASPKRPKIEEVSVSLNTSCGNNTCQEFDKDTESDLTSHTQDVAFRRSTTHMKTIIGVEKYMMTYNIEENNRLSNVKFVLSESFINGVRDDLSDLIKGIKCGTFYKINFSLHTEVVEKHLDISHSHDFQTYNYTIYKESHVETTFISLRSALKNKIASYEEEVGWAVHRIKSITMSINVLNKRPENTFIDLPDDIKLKRAVINIHNSDTMSFKWALLSALYPTHSNRVTSYSIHGYNLKFGGVTFPVILSDIQQVEDLNDLSINVYGLNFSSVSNKHEVIGPIYLTKARKHCHINLLCVYNNGKHHFCYIKNLSRLISRQINASEHSIYVCDSCVHYFSTIRRLIIHQQYNYCPYISPVIPTDEEITTLYIKRFKKKYLFHLNSNI